MNNPRIEPFTEAAEFDGKVIYAVATDNARILLEDAEGGTISAECSAEMVGRIVGNAHTRSIRLIGYATWERTDEGQWKLIRFRASDFRLLRNEDLAESIARLQRVMLSGYGADDGAADSVDDQSYKR